MLFLWFKMPFLLKNTPQYWNERARMAPKNPTPSPPYAKRRCIFNLYAAQYTIGVPLHLQFERRCTYAPLRQSAFLSPLFSLRHCRNYDNATTVITATTLP